MGSLNKERERSAESAPLFVYWRFKRPAIASSKHSGTSECITTSSGYRPTIGEAIFQTGQASDLRSLPCVFNTYLETISRYHITLLCYHHMEYPLLSW